MEFELLRLSLLERQQKSFLEERDTDGSLFTRERWLRTVFSQPIVFRHFKQEFHYVPETNTPETLPLIIGRIGRQVSVEENEPPEAGLHEVRRPAWQAALVIMDPRHHDDGQKVAVEVDGRVGSPFPMFASLCAHIAETRPASPYVIEVTPILDPTTFWDFVKQHEGEITSVTFEFIAPNMFGQSDDYDKEIAEMKAQLKMRKARLQIENPDGLNLDSPRVTHAVNYASRGTGSIKAKTKSKKKFNSEKKGRKATVNIQKKDDFTITDLIKQALSTIFKL